MSDKTVGLPTVWFIGREKTFWHNSMLTMRTIDRDIFAGTCAAIGAWIAAVAALNRETLPDIVTRAGAYALRHVNEEYRRATPQNRDMGDRMKYRLQIDIDRLNDFREAADIPEIERQIALVTAAAEHLVEASKQRLAAEGRHGKWFDYAAAVIPSRAAIGFPHDQAGVSKHQRRMLPDGVIYGPFARILSNMDGRKSLQRLIREAEWEEQTTFSEAQIKKYLGAVMYLGDSGCLNVDYRQELTRMEILDGLRRIRVKNGDCLFVHSSVSAFGRIDGGEETVIEALLEVAGPPGTVLMPAFTVPSRSILLQGH